MRVLGGAGTGKTVVAMHRARWLARQFARELGRQAADGGRILFTTWTRNLAVDIEQNLRLICTPEEMARIEVTNLDRWVRGFLQGQRYDFRVQYGRDDASWERALDLKDAGLEFPDAFYRDEWEQVVLARGVTSEDEYRRVSRVGRGTRLSRAARVKVWRVFEEYRAQLAERGLKEVDDAYRDAASLLDAGAAELAYRSVIVDEAQDMSAQAFRLLRRIVPEGQDNLFLVGDAHQRIYGRSRVVLSRCGINIVGRSRKLRLNYRTTEETRGWAATLLRGRPIDDLDGGADDDRIRSLTHGPEPLLQRFESREAQAAGIVPVPGAPARAGAAPAQRVHRRSHEAGARLDRAGGCGIAICRSSGWGRTRWTTGRKRGCVSRPCTASRDLRFDRVVIASVNAGLVPQPRAYAGAGDRRGAAEGPRPRNARSCTSRPPAQRRNY